MYNNIRLPLILEVKKDILKDFDQVLKNQNLYFENNVLITTKHLHDLYNDKISHIPFKKILFIEKGNIEEVRRLEDENIPENSLIMGFGGGKVIDATKYYATRKQKHYLSIPTALSNDGIYSPVARLEFQGKKESFGVNSPLGILIDIDIIKKSPTINTLSGVGDLISNISALEDWKLANKETKEEINDFAYILSYMAAQPIMNYTKDDMGSTEFLKKLSYGLVLSGLAMEISGNSRPASGSEHMISHAIDMLYPEKVTYHGIQVAYGCLLVEQRFRKKKYELFKNFFKRIGLLEEINKRINFNEEEIQKIIETAKTIRKRYTILSKQ